MTKAKYIQSSANKRLELVRKLAGFTSARSAALHFDWVYPTYRSHENGQNQKIPQEAAERYAKAFNIPQATAIWIEREIGPGPGLRKPKLERSINQQPKIESRNRPRSKKLIEPAADIGTDGLANVPEMDIYGGGARSGGFNQEETTADQLGHSYSRDAIRTHWGIPIPFLRSELHVSPGKANIVPVRGDSMKDALFDGDRAIINLDDTDISQGGIFALLDDSSSLIIKQVEIVRGSRASRIVCSSRNPAYQPFELELTDPVRIIGRVAGKITRL